MEQTGDMPQEDDGEEERLQNEYLDSSLKVEGRKKATDGGQNRMFKFLVTDGVNKFFCIEYRRFPSLTIIEGQKYLLKPPVNSKRSIYMVEQVNLEFICGPKEEIAKPQLPI